ncbi:hypothetical protein JQ615_18070 [Bradyrhizobium jicamae]|uniref:Uncharacterized protein n=1 Tax=Bradyrhizobium jicamae TaxID=280332 RepID=A0ABS5FKJ7_9BRAD|nr:hypothetical protein [Bradyrhizobium jicamae]MBR0797298.1 hypothetical protein [Bradyrhizobium jicamae]
MTPQTAQLLKDLAPVGTFLLSSLSAIIGAAWIAVTYMKSQHDLAATRLFESRKPFLELRLKLYNEAAQITGKLVTSSYRSSEWNAAIYRFWELYWSELSVVEDAKVEAAMAALGTVIGKIATSNGKPRNLQDELEAAVYKLSHALRDGLVAEWGAIKATT